MKASLHWDELETALIHNCHVFDLYRSRRRNGAREGEFYLLKGRDWVNVVPVLAAAAGEERFLMVKQYRQGIDRITVEFPAGLVEEGEKPQAAAARELVEETGFRAERLAAIGTVAPNPAFMNNACHLYCAEGLERAGDLSLDELEVLEVLEVPVREIEERIGREPFLNAMTALALFWYLHHRRSGSPLHRDGER